MNVRVYLRNHRVRDCSSIRRRPKSCAATLTVKIEVQGLNRDIHPTCVIFSKCAQSGLSTNLSDPSLNREPYYIDVGETQLMNGKSLPS